MSPPRSWSPLGLLRRGTPPGDDGQPDAAVRGSRRMACRSPPGMSGPGTGMPPPSPSPATRPRSPPGGSNRCWPTPLGWTCHCTSNRSRP